MDAGTGEGDCREQGACVRRASGTSSGRTRHPDIKYRLCGRRVGQPGVVAALERAQRQVAGALSRLRAACTAVASSGQAHRVTMGWFLGQVPTTSSRPSSSGAWADCIAARSSSGAMWAIFDSLRKRCLCHSFQPSQTARAPTTSPPAAQGLGITVQPDSIACDYLAAGKVETLLEAFAPPELGIYAVLPSNRYMPHGVRVLIDFLSDRLASAAATAWECSEDEKKTKPPHLKSEQAVPIISTRWR